MLLEISGLILGLVGLWLGTRWTINNAITIAKRYQLSEVFVGIGILAVGTDLPELAVAIDAGIRGSQGQETSGMIVGTSIGSAFAQIGLVMGLLGFSGYLLLGRKFLKQHGSVLIGSIVVLWLLSYDGVVNRMDGLILLICFAGYFYLLLSREQISTNNEFSDTATAWSPWMLLAGGIIIVIAASELCVFSATGLAERIGVPQVLIALLIVGIGTSLPELSISLIAIKKQKTALSVSNLMGSNIFDTLVPIGTAALITPVRIDQSTLFFDLPALAALSLIVVAFFLHKKGLQKREAAMLIAIYLLYSGSTILWRSG